VSENIYGVTEVVGTSPDGIDQAVRVAIGRASSTLRGLNWFEVTEVRGHIVDGEVAHYQVSLKVGFRMDAPDGETNRGAAAAG
jgi:dodecin